MVITCNQTYYIFTQILWENRYRRNTPEKKLTKLSKLVERIFLLCEKARVNVDFDKVDRTFKMSFDRYYFLFFRSPSSSATRIFNERIFLNARVLYQNSVVFSPLGEVVTREAEENGEASLLMLIEFEKHWSSGLLSKYGSIT